MNNGKTSRRFLTPALAALALAGGLVTGAAATGARAEDGSAATPAAKLDLKAGRELFNTWSCSACHTLSDAGSTGAVGPSLDNPNLTHDFIVNRIINGSGPMPSFGGQIDNASIDALADYIVAVNHEHAAPAVASAPAGDTSPSTQ